jgi:hypothetical protein
MARRREPTTDRITSLRTAHAAAAFSSAVQSR